LKGFNATELAQILGYKSLKSQLRLTNDGLLDYMKNKLIKDYQGKSLTVAI